MQITEIIKEPIERATLHLELFEWVKKNKGEEAAKDFHKRYVDIERSRGVKAAMGFQIKRAKEWGLTLKIPPTTPINYEVVGNKVTITLFVREPFQETEEEYNERKKE